MSRPAGNFRREGFEPDETGSMRGICSHRGFLRMLRDSIRIARRPATWMPLVTNRKPDGKRCLIAFRPKTLITNRKRARRRNELRNLARPKDRFLHFLRRHGARVGNCSAVATTSTALSRSSGGASPVSLISDMFSAVFHRYWRFLGWAGCVRITLRCKSRPPRCRSRSYHGGSRCNRRDSPFGRSPIPNHGSAECWSLLSRRG